MITLINTIETRITMAPIGQVISGEYGKILVRQKSEKDIELGELVVADTENCKIIMQVYDLLYGSQISQQNLELISGMNLEDNAPIDFMDPHLRNYKLALLKTLVTISKNNARLCKTLPNFFSEIREIKEDDLSFLTTPDNSLLVGNLRSGSKELEVKVHLDGQKVFQHHILIPATTGRGKSNLVKVMLWSQLSQRYAGILVLDPHDEYFGRNSKGLKDHPESNNVVYYTPKDVPSGQRTLKINIKSLRPHHFNGVLNLSDPQKQAMYAYSREYGSGWIEAVALEKPLKFEFAEGTLNVLRRMIVASLSLRIIDGELRGLGVFDEQAGETTVQDIVNELESGKTVIVDTSSFAGSIEILIGSMITYEVFKRYKNYKLIGSLNDKPVISIVLEEAPRVLGKEVLEKGSNVFETIAREGRKFNVGLTAITQLPSLIPRQILANMNTKIILGIEMAPERQAIIDSASQDLSSDSRNIASLDKGEAIITSNFARFAIPVKIPLFESVVSKEQKVEAKKAFDGVSLN
jgi:hypothetical protein